MTMCAWRDSSLPIDPDALALLLDRRELDVVLALSLGKTMADINRTMHKGECWIDYAMKRARTKTNCSNNYQLIALVARSGLFDREMTKIKKLRDRGQRWEQLHARKSEKSPLLPKKEPKRVTVVSVNLKDSGLTGQKSQKSASM